MGAPSPGEGSEVTRDVVQQRAAALEVRGASTGAWMRNTLQVEPPRFTEPGIELVGGRRMRSRDVRYNAVLLSYRVAIGDEQVSLTAAVLKNLRSDELNDGQGYQVGNLILRLRESDGIPIVSYVDPDEHVGYVFASERLTPGELLTLVGSTDLIHRAQQRR
jgi:hypothetical protein